LDIESEFTISVPLSQGLKKQISFCGTRSGRKTNKFDECDITPAQSQLVNVPIIKECELHFECKVVAKHQLIKELMDSTIRNRHYPEDDYHMIFYGEILKCYKLI
jgi:flavin reductase (DIM6/NTAB) family NADH-FMN oxidoreductase RutF